MSGDLVTFLRARLDEDEAAAKGAGEDSSPSWCRGSEQFSGMVVTGDGEIVVYDEGRPSEAEADHIARHDPARALREVEAGRAILDQLGTDLSYRPPVPLGHQRAWAIATLIVEAMASTYADHPDYQESWKP